MADVRPGAAFVVGFSRSITYPLENPAVRNEKPMTVQDAVTLLKTEFGEEYTERTLRKAIRNGWLRAEKFGHVWQVYRSDLVEWLNNDEAHRQGRPRSNP